MKVFVNNEPMSISEESTIAELLEQININTTRGVAIALNEEIIPKSQLTNHKLADNDKITIIKASQGG